MITEIKHFKKLLNGLNLISIQAYSKFNPFGVQFIAFYELRKYNRCTSHHFIKTIQMDNDIVKIKNEIKKIIEDLK